MAQPQQPTQDDPKLTLFIQGELQQGRNVREIRAMLKQAGWSDPALDRSFELAIAHSKPRTQQAVRLEPVLVIQENGAIKLQKELHAEDKPAAAPAAPRLVNPALLTEKKSKSVSLSERFAFLKMDADQRIRLIQLLAMGVLSWLLVEQAWLIAARIL